MQVLDIGHQGGVPTLGKCRCEGEQPDVDRCQLAQHLCGNITALIAGARAGSPKVTCRSQRAIGSCTASSPGLCVDDIVILNSQQRTLADVGTQTGSCNSPRGPCGS